MRRGYFPSSILEKIFLRDDVFQLLIEFPEKPMPLPGQFVMIRLEGVFLPRPMSISDFNNGIMTLSIGIKGKGTKALSQLPEGSRIEVMGPLGNGFPMPEEGEYPLLLAGGMGFAPLLFLDSYLRQRGHTPDFLYGEASEGDICLKNRNILISTIDGSRGYGGTIVDFLDIYIADNPRAFHIYTCGPLAMYASLKELDLDYPAHASLEEHMACGIGACYGCVTPVSGNRRVCLDGPVFPLSEVVTDV